VLTCARIARPQRAHATHACNADKYHCVNHWPARCVDDHAPTCLSVCMSGEAQNRVPGTDTDTVRNVTFGVRNVTFGCRCSYALELLSICVRKSICVCKSTCVHTGALALSGAPPVQARAS